MSFAGNSWSGPIAAAAGVLSLALFSATASASVEAVADGGFDAATCTTGLSGDCTSPVWDEGIAGGGVGPICQLGVGSCGYFEGPTLGNYSPPNWVQMGGETSMGPTLSYAVEQEVKISDGPATLRFQLLTRNSNVSTGTFAAKIDGTTVFSATGSTPGYATYAPVSVNVSAFAGGTHTLRFEATDQQGNGSSDSFNIDDVSLLAAGPRCHGRSATIVGTGAAELLLGTRGADVILASGGGDVVKAGGGKDIVCGGAGNDELRGQGGRDKLFGGNGKDRLIGGRGRRDLCNGDAGKDRASRSCERKRDL